MFSKHYLPICLLISLMLLTACARQTIPDTSTPEAVTESVTVPSSASEQEPIEVVASASKKLALLESIFACMERVESLQASQLKTEIKRLQSKSVLAQSIPDKVNADSLVERFSLACLLSREQASDGDWDRAQAILEELALAFEHEDERQLVRYVERSLKMQRNLRRHQAQLNRLRQQNSELQNKIEQLKGLEQDLDVNNPYSAERDL